MKKNKKGQVALLFAFFVSAIIIIIISAVFAPMGVLFNTKMYEAGEDILLQANDSIENIQDTEVKTAIQNVIGSAKDSTQTNIDVNGSLFQYGWIFLLILTAIIAYLFTRRTIEFGSSGGFI